MNSLVQYELNMQTNNNALAELCVLGNKMSEILIIQVGMYFWTNE